MVSGLINTSSLDRFEEVMKTNPQVDRLVMLRMPGPSTTTQ
jgi:hypothetical protein